MLVTRVKAFTIYVLSGALLMFSQSCGDVASSVTDPGHEIKSDKQRQEEG